MRMTLIGTALATALLAGTALAQTPATPNTNTTQTSPTTPGNQTQTSPTTATQVPNTGGVTTPGSGLVMGKTAPANVQFGQGQPADTMTSKLVGTDVYNTSNEKVGEIADIAVRSGQNIAGVIVSVGGFLGMGEKYIFVTPSSIAIDHQDGQWRAYMNTTKDALNAAPTFNYSNRS